MAKVKKAFFCKNCGFEAPKWLGRCPSCGEWNTFTEEIIARESGSVAANAAGPLPAAKPQRVGDIRESEHRRIDVGNGEVNRVLGGGMVPGSLILVGGEPGIGKSTLSLQIALAANGLKTLYVSGEESAEQIKMRAGRIGIGNDECLIYPETLLENIVRQIGEHRPDLVVIDSIQTIYTDLLDSSAGSVSQIRECAATLLKYAKSTGTSIFIIGHITKDGNIAGPKILEHIVDVVLQFEGDSNNIYRILRGIKNRFGATFEIGVFEMLDSGFFNSIFSKRDTCFVSSSSGSFKNLIYLLLGKCCENLLCLFHGCNLCSKGFRCVDDGWDSVLFFCHLGILLFVFSLKVFTVTCYVFIIQIN